MLTLLSIWCHIYLLTISGGATERLLLYVSGEWSCVVESGGEGWWAFCGGAVIGIHISDAIVYSLFNSIQAFRLSMCYLFPNPCRPSM